MAKNYVKLAGDILEAVGGPANVSAVFHCVTRLRFNLKDQSIPDDDVIKNINGVLGIAKAGGQYQIIIGNDVGKVYNEVCKLGDFERMAAIDEDLDNLGPKEKLTVKGVVSSIMNYITGSITDLLPILVSATMVKGVQTLLTLIGVLKETSNTYIVMNMVYNGFFYFMPIYIGYSASKRLKTNVPLGIFLTSILLTQDLINVVAAGEPFSVYGIPMRLVSYNGTMFPALLTIYVLKLVNDWAEKHISDNFAMSFRPTIVLLIMLPLELCVFGPIGGYIGDGLAWFIKLVSRFPFITGAVGGVWLFIVATGMHMPLVQAINVPEQMQYGYQKIISPGVSISNCIKDGMVFAAIAKTKIPGNRVTYGSFLVAGVAEPGLYGVVFKHPKNTKGLAIGGAILGSIMGILGVKKYPVASIPLASMSVLGWIPGGLYNTIAGTAMCFLAYAFGFVWAYFYGLEGEEFDRKKIAAPEETV